MNFLVIYMNLFTVTDMHIINFGEIILQIMLRTKINLLYYFLGKTWR